MIPTNRNEKRAFYSALHHWLKYHFGKASKCENKECLGIGSTYEWALKKGCLYEYKRENFIELCHSCHRKYDITEAILKKINSMNIYANATQCKRGHKFTPENTYVRKQLRRDGKTMQTSRNCKTCKYETVKAYRRKTTTLLEQEMNK